MAYKKIEQSFSFADIALNKNADRNRSMQFLRKVNKTIDWKPVEKLLVEHYQIGKSKEGERAYSPLLLFKCLLLQNWFQIKSDPELENLICDRLSFRDFLKLPMDYPSPDHSTFSRFRKNISKEVMIKVNSEILKQFHRHGISINKGVAVDARLVKSASKPISKKQIKRLKAHLDTPESRLDKNNNLKKFSRDFESDWTIKNDKPHYGFKEHTSVDTENGFILSTTLSPSSHNDSKYLPYAVVYSMHADKIKIAYADKGYAGAPNREFLALNNIQDGIMRKDNINSKLTDFEIKRNKAISKYRYIVEQYFGISHLHDRGNKARFPTMIKNTIDIMFRQFAFNLKKGSKILEVLPV